MNGIHYRLEPVIARMRVGDSIRWDGSHQNFWTYAKRHGLPVKFSARKTAGVRLIRRVA